MFQSGMDNPLWVLGLLQGSGANSAGGKLGHRLALVLYSKRWSRTMALYDYGIAFVTWLSSEM